MSIKEQVFFENHGTNSFMVYELDANEVTDTTGVGMLSYNKIQGVLPFNFTQMDSDRYFKFNITSKLSLAQYLSGSVRKAKLLNVFLSIANAIISSEEYMLEADRFLIDENYIYVDASTKNCWLAYIPLASGEIQSSSFNDFVRNIMSEIQFDDSESGDYVLKILSFMNRNPRFSLLEFKKLMEDLSGVNTSKTAHEPVTEFKAIEQQQKVENQIKSQEQWRQEEQKQEPLHTKNKNDNQHSEQKESEKIKEAQKKDKTDKPKANNLGFDIPGMETAVAEVQEEVEDKQQSKKPGLFGSIFSSNKTKKEKKPKFVEIEEEVNYKKRTVTEINTGEMERLTSKQGTSFNFSAQNQPVIVAPQTPNMGETTVLGAGNLGETTVLGSAGTLRPYLLRETTGEKIYLNKPVYRIGKEPSSSDYVCINNTAISRAHADFITRNGEYFVRDNNSTNGTFVNGGRIPISQDVKIKHEDKILLADEAFEFKLY